MSDASNQDRVFEAAAELFGLLATPVRLRIVHAVSEHEKNVTELLAEIPATQPNMSQHLGTLYRSGVLARRREGTQIYYRLRNEGVAQLCQSIFGTKTGQDGAACPVPAPGKAPNSGA